MCARECDRGAAGGTPCDARRKRKTRPIARRTDKNAAHSAPGTGTTMAACLALAPTARLSQLGCRGDRRMRSAILLRNAAKRALSTSRQGRTRTRTAPANLPNRRNGNLSLFKKPFSFFLPALASSMSLSSLRFEFVNRKRRRCDIIDLKSIN